MTESSDIEYPGLSRREALRLLAAAAMLPAAAVAPRAAALAAGAANGESAMEDVPLIQRPIPSSGEMLPVVGLGTWETFDAGESAAARRPLREVLARCAARGARLVDSSPMYGSAEQVVGDLAGELGLRRSLFLATKVWTTGREAGIAQMSTSLARLGVERLDLMQVHNLVDAGTHLRTLAEWKAAGKIRYLGVTHYLESAHPRLEDLVRTRRLDFVQVNYSLAERGAETRLLRAAQERGVAVIANRPFAGSAMFERVRGKQLPPWAAEIGCASWAQFFLKFILGHPAVTCVIPGTAKLQHLEDNLAAGRPPLPDEPTRKRMAAAFDRL